MNRKKKTIWSVTFDIFLHVLAVFKFPIFRYSIINHNYILIVKNTLKVYVFKRYTYL